jgi:hypothetical protein
MPLGLSPYGEAALLGSFRSCRFCADRAEHVAMDQMDQQTIHKTYKEKLRPTPAQVRALEAVLWRCRDLYNIALEQRIIVY